MEKICRKCKKLKDVTHFGKRKNTKDGLNYHCLNCNRAYERQLYERKCLLLGKEIKSPSRKIKPSKDVLHQEMLENSRRYRKRHPDRRKKSCFDYNKRNRTKNREYWNNKYNSDPQFNLTIKLRRRVYMSIKNNSKDCKKHDLTIKLLGCSFRDYKAHIESKFTQYMKWEHVLSSEIHMDHIIPVSAFDLSDPEQQKLCFHYTNYQPLWATTEIAIKYGESSDYIGNLEKGRKEILPNRENDNENFSC